MPALTRRLLPALFLVVPGLLASACGTGRGSADAATDAGTDAGDAAPDVGPPVLDAGPVCNPTCAFDESCCGTPAAPLCTDTRTDEENCGLCGTRCADGRGTTCRFGRCACGLFEEGCLGTELSFCCPPRATGEDRYCANLVTDSDDCGECGLRCRVEQADRCAAGRCVCGDRAREGCLGTPESTCCPDVTGTTASCEDTTTSILHCGRCATRCAMGERCAGGVCTRGAAECPEGCEEGTICCEGTCCPRSVCQLGRCGAAAEDAGTPDAGAMDAGAPDAGAEDGGGA